MIHADLPSGLGGGGVTGEFVCFRPRKIFQVSKSRGGLVARTRRTETTTFQSLRLLPKKTASFHKKGIVKKRWAWSWTTSHLFTKGTNGVNRIVVPKTSNEHKIVEGVRGGICAAQSMGSG